MYLIFFKTNKIGNKFNKHFQDPKPMKSQFKSKKKKKSHKNPNFLDIKKNISKTFINQRKEKKNETNSQDPKPYKTKQIKNEIKVFFREKKKRKK